MVSVTSPITGCYQIIQIEAVLNMDDGCINSPKYTITML